jgi:hypothetical protein
VRRLAALALALAALPGCAAERDTARLAGGEPLAVTLELTPRTTSFGDPVTATIGVLYDPARVDPASLRIRTSFRPWRATQTVERAERNGLSLLRYTFRLTCLTGPCTSDERQVRYLFPDAELAWRERREKKLQLLPWPELEVATRLPRTYVAPEPGDATPPPWRAAAVVPEPSYRVEPRRLRAGLLALGVLLVGASALLSVAALRAPRAPRAVPPLDLALAQLERARTPAERRAALEAVAAELHPALAVAARELAWSEVEPSVPAAQELTARVRGAGA